MSSTGTPKYGLNQWQGSDKPKREDFNSDNQKIDAALDELNSKIADANHGDITGLPQPIKTLPDYANAYQVYDRDDFNDGKPWVAHDDGFASIITVTSAEGQSGALALIVAIVNGVTVAIGDVLMIPWHSQGYGVDLRISTSLIPVSKGDIVQFVGETMGEIWVNVEAEIHFIPAKGQTDTNTTPVATYKKDQSTLRGIKTVYDSMIAKYKKFKDDMADDKQKKVVPTNKNKKKSEA